MADANALRASYDTRVAVAERLAEQICELINANNISVAVPVEVRVKSWQSLSDKVERKKLGVSDVADVKDFVGIRIILLFRRDLERVIQLISSSLEIISTEDALEKLGVEMFGYQSVHLQARIPPGWREVPTLRDLSGLEAEIQVRTAAQHIWAAASHKLQYKKEASVPAQLLRSVNRVAALLETVDLEFERALLEREAYVAQASASLQTNADALKDAKLNVDLLKKLLDQKLPEGNLYSGEDFETLLEDMRNINISSVSDLTKIIDTHLGEVLKEDARIAKALLKKASAVGDGRVEGKIEGESYAGDAARIKRGVFYSHTGLVREMLSKAGLVDWLEVARNRGRFKAEKS